MPIQRPRILIFKDEYGHSCLHQNILESHKASVGAYGHDASNRSTLTLTSSTYYVAIVIAVDVTTIASTYIHWGSPNPLNYQQRGISLPDRRVQCTIASESNPTRIGDPIDRFNG